MNCQALNQTKINFGLKVVSRYSKSYLKPYIYLVLKQLLVDNEIENLLVGNQLIELGGLVTRIAIPQRMVMSALNDGDGINLDIAEVFNR